MLRDALDSVQAQTFREFETIVVDDGSVEDIAAEVSRHAVRPRIIRQTQKGAAAARNRGVAESHGGWIAFLDSDDLWLPTKLERFMEAAQTRSDIVVWYGPMQPIDAARQPVT